MKRAVCIILSVLQLVLLAGAATLPLLDGKFMSMMRYLANKNRVWNAAPWAGWLPIAVTAVMAMLLVWAVAMLVRRGTNGPKRPFVLLAVITLAAGAYMLFASTAVLRAYWFVGVMLAAIAIFQAIKCLCRKTAKIPKQG